MINGFESTLHEDLRYRDLKIPEQLSEVASRIFFFYLACFRNEKLPQITRQQENAYAAAFILMGLGSMNDVSVKPDVLMNVFGVTERRLENALKKIFITMQNAKES